MENNIVREMRFTHADEAAAAIRGVDVEFSVLSSSTRHWQLTEARVGDSILVSGEMGAALFSVGAIGRDALWFVAPIDMGGRFTINGRALGHHSVAFMPEGTEHAAYMSAPTHWASLQIPRNAFQRKVYDRKGCVVPEGLSFFEDREAAPSPFRSAVETALRFIADHPGALHEPEVQARLEKALLDALVRSFAEPSAAEAAKSQAVVARITECLAEHHDEVLYPSDLCDAVSISERTLRRYFEEAFEISPGRFLRLRRLNQARRALRSGVFASVTEVGIRYGFFDLGRFAADYRELFGEFPSQTLSRPPRAVS
jgi:AraC family ethanolamine operon transcriptional activator